MLLDFAASMFAYVGVGDLRRCTTD